MAEQIALALIDGKISQIPSGDTIRGAGSGSLGDGSLLNPFTLLNIKNVRSGFYYKIGSDLESVVTREQTISGILIIDGVNTIL
jgi:hypothetical protein